MNNNDISLFEAFHRIEKARVTPAHRKTALDWADPESEDHDVWEIFGNGKLLSSWTYYDLIETQARELMTGLPKHKQGELESLADVCRILAHIHRRLGSVVHDVQNLRHHGVSEVDIHRLVSLGYKENLDKDVKGA